MKEVTGEVRTIHPETLKECPQETILSLLKVARDLRSGAIKNDLFIMRHFTTLTDCGTAHCIGGWVAHDQGFNNYRLVKWANQGAELRSVGPLTERQGNLFAGGWPSDPQLAADAIEEYVYNYALNPWAEAIDAHKKHQGA